MPLSHGRCGQLNSVWHVLRTFLALLLVLLLIATHPHWSYSRIWGYYSCSALSALLAIVLLMALLGRI